MAKLRLKSLWLDTCRLSYNLTLVSTLISYFDRCDFLQVQSVDKECVRVHQCHFVTTLKKNDIT